ncbi:tRNA lysidine(34) synthetase TilS [Niveibacterium terrae]|uniref:tRNA lysidine(34) synthetase TilS n=1 Tax=Niveibacterium terrae TaxID=3373598 RepID=UPI003A901E23
MAASRSRLSPDLAQRVAERLAPLLLPGQRLAVAFSGGLDSTVLLHLMAMLAPRLGITVDAIHVAHGLQNAALAWPEHCRSVCAELGVPLRCVAVDVDRANPQGLEAAARTARHEALRAQGADWIALAHHRADQAETLLHRLSRGAGVAGAAAMRELDCRGAPLLRPLLSEPRAELETWARAHGLRWIEDPSNTDLRFSRNFIRHEILAPLKARFPGAEAALARAATHFNEAQSLLEELAEEDLARVRVGRCASLAALKALSPARLANLLRHRLACRDLPAPDASQLHELMRQLAASAAPRRIRFPLWALCVEDDQVWIEASALPEPGADGEWDLAAPLSWGVAHLIPTDSKAGPLVLRARSGGEKIRPDARRPARDLKRLAREAGIPPWWRELIPVIWQQGRAIGWGPFFDASLAAPPCRIELPERFF